MFNIPCPTCGVTRAIFALFKLNIGQYCSYNIMALFLITSIWLKLNEEFFSKKKLINYYLFLVLIINTCYYLYRLSTGNIL